MAKVEVNGITYYIRRGIHPAYGKWTSRASRDALIHFTKPAVRARLTSRRLGVRTTVADYLLVDVAHEVGFDPEDILEVMSGRPYAY